MKPFFPQKFLKQLKKLSPKEQDKFYEVMELFCEDDLHPTLHNHKLHGTYQGYRSIDITGDIRAVFRVLPEEIVRFAAIGTHHQLFGS